jgi:cytochrome c oxidase assembly protein subunit 15
LVFVGGLVTSYDAGMAVPDWPTTYGYNLFLYPWETWFFGPWDLFIEHGHRLLGALVGMLTIALVAAAWLTEHRRSVRWLTVVALIAVCVQGALGGLRVQLNEVLLARIHGCFGPAFFALAAAIAAVTSRRWQDAQPVDFAGAGKLQRIAVLTAVLAYTQLVIGAHLRHMTANMSTGAFRIAVVFHLIVAAALAVHVVALVLRLRPAARAVGRWPRSGLALPALLVVQLLLGGGAWVVKYGWPSWFANTQFQAAYTVQEHSLLQAGVVTAHVATGSLIVAMSVLAALWTTRFVRLSSSSAGQGTTQSVRTVVGGLVLAPLAWGVSR